MHFSPVVRNYWPLIKSTEVQTCVLLFLFTLVLLPLGLLTTALPKSLELEAFLSTPGLGFEAFLSMVGLAALELLLFLSVGFDTFLSNGRALISLGFKLFSTLKFSYTGAFGLLLSLSADIIGDFLIFSWVEDEVSERGDFSETRALEAMVWAAYPLTAAVRMPVRVLRRPEGKPRGVRMGEGAPSL